MLRKLLDHTLLHFKPEFWTFLAGQCLSPNMSMPWSPLHLLGIFSGAEHLEQSVKRISDRMSKSNLTICQKVFTDIIRHLDSS